MNYNNIIELDAVTLEDCMDMYSMKNCYAVIKDGHVSNFVKESE